MWEDVAGGEVSCNEEEADSEGGLEGVADVVEVDVGLFRTTSPLPFTTPPPPPTILLTLLDFDLILRLLPSISRTVTLSEEFILILQPNSQGMG